MPESARRVPIQVDDATIRTYDSRDEPSAAFDMGREISYFTALIPTGGHILDLGCGTAWAAAHLRQQGFRAVGLDLSFGRLSRALASAAAPVVMADQRWLPLATASLEGVWASASLLHLSKPDMPAALAEVRRVLRPHGALFVSLKAGDGEAWTTRGGGARFFAYYRPAELDGLLADAGLRIVDGWENPAPPWDVAHPWLTRFAVAGGASRD